MKAPRGLPEQVGREPGGARAPALVAEEQLLAGVGGVPGRA